MSLNACQTGMGKGREVGELLLGRNCREEILSRKEELDERRRKHKHGEGEGSDEETKMRKSLGKD